MENERVPEETGAAADAHLQWVLANVQDALRGLQFGVITLTVQDGVVVQVERTERRRYQRGTAPRTGKR